MVEAVLQEKLYSELEDSSTVEPALNTPRDLWKPLFYQVLLLVTTPALIVRYRNVNSFSLIYL